VTVLARAVRNGVFGAVAILLLLATTLARAGFPPAYSPLVIEPTIQGEILDFDLRPAQARARAENKSLYVYLGASNCAFCRKYEAFLDAHSPKLVPHFAKDYIVVDLRGDVRKTGDKVILRTETLHLPYLAFQEAIGDLRTRTLTYPNVWLLSVDGKPLMQMPSGAGTFETVPEQIEILQLVN
jgi:hypothetical protein